MLRSDYKAKGGLIRIRAEISENRIDDIMITGDFFIFPEDSIEKIENELRGREFNLNEINDIVQNILKDSESSITAGDIINAIRNLRE